MVKTITNRMLLEHMQAMKIELQEQIGRLEKKVDGTEGRVMSLEERMTRGFEEAREHRQALQEDLEATMRMLARHNAKLARL